MVQVVQVGQVGKMIYEKFRDRSSKRHLDNAMSEIFIV